MPRFGKRSEANLEGVDPKLVQFLRQAIKVGPDFTVTDGLRTTEDQQKLYAQGRTEPGPILTYADGVIKKSNHQSGRAVDLAPYPIDYEDRERFYYLAGYLMALAQTMNIPLEWGGHWPGKKQDLPHFQLKEDS